MIFQMCLPCMPALSDGSKHVKRAFSGSCLENGWIVSLCESPTKQAFASWNSLIYGVSGSVYVCMDVYDTSIYVYTQDIYTFYIERSLHILPSRSICQHIRDLVFIELKPDQMPIPLGSYNSYNKLFTLFYACAHRHTHKHVFIACWYCLKEYEFIINMFWKIIS